MSGQAIVVISNSQWQVFVATTPGELTRGLGGITAIPPGTGMLFDLGWEQIITVTTEPMLFNLDVAFISDTLVITEVYRNVEPDCLVTSDYPARYFLEVNASELEGIESGDRVMLQIFSLAPVETADWTSSIISFAAFMMVMAFMADIMRSLISSGEQKLLAQTTKRDMLSSLISEELYHAGLGNVADEVCQTVDKRCQTSDWLELWDGTTFERQTPHYGTGLRVLSLIEAEVSLRTKLSYQERLAVVGRINSKLKQADSIILDDGTIFRKTFVPGKRDLVTLQTKRGQTPAAQLLEKWLKAKTRNSAQALRDLKDLNDKYGYDVYEEYHNCIEALNEYRDITGEDYEDYQEYQEARNDAWDQFLECLEELVGVEEEIMQSKLPQTGKCLTRSTVIPTEKRPYREGDLEFLPDSPEFLAYTIDDIGYRGRIDNAFQQAIARAKRSK